MRGPGRLTYNFKRFPRLSDDDKISLVFKAGKISKANDILSRDFAILYNYLLAQSRTRHMNN